MIPNNNLRYRVVAIGEQYHWLDRKTKKPLTYKNGSEAQFNSMDEAIAAFVDGQLSANMNQALMQEATRG